MVRLPKPNRSTFTFRLAHNIKITLKTTNDKTTFYYRIDREPWLKFATHYLRYCPACKEQQPNQMAHMEPGYCLSEEWSTTPCTRFKFHKSVDKLLTLSRYQVSRLQRLLEHSERNFRRFLPLCLKTSSCPCPDMRPWLTRFRELKNRRDISYYYIGKWNERFT